MNNSIYSLFTRDYIKTITVVLKKSVIFKVNQKIM